MDDALQLAPQLTLVPITMMLAALGLSRATFYRHRARASAPPSEPSPRPSPARALSDEERADVLCVLDSARFCDQSPAEVYASLLEEGTYLCSPRTMYRVLAANRQVRERRNQLRHPAYTRPELIADGPNQVWTWDITKLKTFEKFVYLHLYVLLDIFSRYVVGWMIADRESAALAERFLKETIEKYDDVDPERLTTHSDRGSAMRSQTVAQLLANMDVTQSFSRPRVSNDNPFSESQFKTVKYHPTFPDRFTGLDHGLDFGRQFFPWYNDEHHHSGLAYLTPATVHFGRTEEVLAARDATLLDAYLRHPEGFRAPPKCYRARYSRELCAAWTMGLGGVASRKHEDEGHRQRRWSESRLMALVVGSAVPGARATA